MKSITSSLPTLQKFVLHKTSNMLGGDGTMVKKGYCPDCYHKMRKTLKGDYICKGLYRGRFYHSSKLLKVK